MSDVKMRLHKFISVCGFSSRRKAEEMIASGQVLVNGKRASLGDKIDPGRDEIRVSGKKLFLPEKHMYIMLNKPRGFITTMKDERGRKCVASLVKDAGATLFPVGRLDKDSQGLLLFTTDGEFANSVIHPAYQIPKTYRVTVSPSITEEQIKILSDGVELDGKLTRPAKVRILKKGEDKDAIEIVISEGRNREIRRMCEKVGLEVRLLNRTAIGTLKLAALRPGMWRHLTENEVQALLGYSQIDTRKKL